MVGSTNLGPQFSPSSASQTMDPVRPPARQGTGMVKRLQDEWKGGPARQTTVPDGPLPHVKSCSADWGSGRLKQRSVSATELQRSSASGPSRLNRPQLSASESSLPGFLDARQAQDPRQLAGGPCLARTELSASAGSLPGLEGAQRARELGSQDSVGAVFSSTAKPDFNNAFVKLPPVKPGRHGAGRSHGKKSGLIAHVHAHHHHHYHVVLRAGGSINATLGSIAGASGAGGRPARPESKPAAASELDGVAR